MAGLYLHHFIVIMIELDQMLFDQYSDTRFPLMGAFVLYSTKYLSDDETYTMQLIQELHLDWHLGSN